MKTPSVRHRPSFRMPQLNFESSAVRIFLEEHRIQETDIQGRTFWLDPTSSVVAMRFPARNPNQEFYCRGLHRERKGGRYSAERTRTPLSCRSSSRCIKNLHATGQHRRPPVYSLSASNRAKKAEHSLACRRPLVDVIRVPFVLRCSPNSSQLPMSSVSHRLKAQRSFVRSRRILFPGNSCDWGQCRK